MYKHFVLRKAFTLIEVVLAIAVGLIIIAGVSVGYNYTKRAAITDNQTKERAASSSAPVATPTSTPTSTPKKSPAVVTSTPASNQTYILSSAHLNTWYSRPLGLTIPSPVSEQWQVLGTSGQLPQGLSVIHLEHGCAPSPDGTPSSCPQNEFDLNGNPTKLGKYNFSVRFNIGGKEIVQQYQVEVLPYSKQFDTNLQTNPTTPTPAP